MLEGHPLRFSFGIRRLRSPLTSSRALFTFFMSFTCFSYLFVNSIPIDSLVWSTLFNNPLGGGPHTICTGSLPTYRQILLRIVCTNFWPVSHTSLLPMEKARFLYGLLHGDSIDLPTFICHHILCTFKILGHRIAFPMPVWFTVWWHHMGLCFLIRSLIGPFVPLVIQLSPRVGPMFLLCFLRLASWTCWPNST